MSDAATPVGQSLLAFSYQAQNLAGQPISGSIDAAGLDEALQQLQSLGLRIVSIEPSVGTPTRQALRHEDFLAFNEQLAQLTTAGLPIEHGLKLIAQDLHGGRLAATVNAIADELERGTSLADAISKNESQFPPLYARLVEAGVKSNSLGGLLFNLSVHLEMVRRLRATLWRTISYPLMVLIGLMIVLLFLSHFVFPQFREMSQMYRPYTPIVWRWQFPPPTPAPFPAMPLISQFLFWFGDLIPYLAIATTALLVILPALCRTLYYSGNGTIERWTFRVPFIGPILRMSVLARWCDIARLGVTAGLDLPAAVHLASDAIASPNLARDSADLIHDLESGRPLDANDALLVLPKVIPASIEMASRTNNLRDVLASLSDVYRRQAESRLENLPTILSPILLLIMALSVGVVIAGLMLPVLNFIRYVSGVL